LLTSHRIGDNNQVLALAEALGWPFETKRLTYRTNKLLTKLISNQVLGVTLAGIDKRKSSELHPPWPDLVVSAGRDNEPVARWIQKQSGGRSRLVHMGRPWAPLSAFDLIVTTPQYFLPQRQNILTNALPLHRVTPQRLRDAAIQWAPRVAHLKRPYTAVLVGGNSGHLVLDACKGRRLGQLANKLCEASGGSLLISNSARTPGPAYDALCAELTAPAHIYHWADGADSNPYFGYLALADQIVVTGESVSMLTEASSTGKPLFIFDLGDKAHACTQVTRSWFRKHLNKLRYRSLRHWLTKRLGPRRMHRDIGKIQRQLVASGRARWLGGPAQTATDTNVKQHDIHGDAQRIVTRVRSLFDQS